MNSTNWPAPNVKVFIAQLVEHYTTNAETMGSNPNEVLNIFWGGGGGGVLICNKLQLPL